MGYSTYAAGKLLRVAVLSSALGFALVAGLMVGAPPAVADLDPKAVHTTWADPSSGDYGEETVDISVNILGDRGQIVRSFMNGAWDFGYLTYPQQIEVPQFLDEPRTPGRKTLFTVTASRLAHSGYGYFDSVGAVTAGVFYSESGDRLEREEEGWLWVLKDGEQIRYTEGGYLLSLADWKGRAIRMQYDAETNRIAGVLDHFSNQVFWIEYLTNRVISSVRDQAAGGREVIYQYDTLGRMTNVVDFIGDSTAYTYDSQNRIVSKRWAGGREERIAYGPDGTISSLTDEEGVGEEYEFSYNENAGEYYAYRKNAMGVIWEEIRDSGFRDAQVLVNGQALYVAEDSVIVDEPTLQYDDRGNVTRITHPGGGFEQFFYAGPYSRLVREISSDGRTNIYRYNERWELTNMVREAGTAKQRSGSLSYDELGNLVAVRSSGDASLPPSDLSIEYDEYGNPTRFTLPDGTETEIAYNRMGRPLSITDSHGNSSVMEYDAMGRETRISEPNGVETFYQYGSNWMTVSNSIGRNVTYMYDHDGNITEVFSDGAVLESFTYDALGRLVEERGATDLVRISYAYDDLGRVTTVNPTDQSAVTFEYDPARLYLDMPVAARHATYSVEPEYDDSGRITAMDTMLATGTSFRTEYGYDDLGRIAWESTPAGLMTRYAYDDAGRMQSWSNQVQGETRMEFNAGSMLRAVVDGEGNEISLLYDIAGRVTNVVRPGGYVFTYSYDRRSQPTEITTPAGRRQTMCYDAAGRVTQVVAEVVAPPGGGATGGGGNTLSSAISYDRNNNIARISSDSVSQEFTYNKKGQVIREDVDYGPFALQTAYSYDTAQPLVESMGLPDGTTILVGREPFGRVSEIRIPSLEPEMSMLPISFGDYDAWNSPQTITYPGGTTVHILRSDDGSVASIRTSDPAGNPLYDDRYKYSPEGKLLEAESEGRTLTFDYDLGGRLVGVEDASQQQSYVLETFSYDDVGNMMSKAGTAFEYEDGYRLTGYGDTSCTYDPDGNLVRKETSEKVLDFTYNAAGYLTEVRDGLGDVVAEYGYNAQGLRMWKQVDGEVTYFHYTGDKLAGEYDAAGNPIRIYGQYPGSPNYPLFIKQGDEYYWMINDGRGAVRKIVDSSGQVVWAGEYDSYGSRTESINTIDNPLGMAGMYYDEETGLYYNGGYYDPEVGRYVTPDRATDIRQTNPYIWGNNSPYLTTEPSLRTKLGKMFGFMDTILKPVHMITRPICGTVNILYKYGTLPLAPVISELAGDKPDWNDIVREFPEDQCSFFLSMNGIANDYEQSSRLEKEFYDILTAATGLEPMRFQNAAKVNTTHGIAGLRDILPQCLATHMGLADLPAVWLAAQMKAIVGHCRSVGRSPGNCCIYLFGHSQGTSISDRALGLLLPGERAFVRYVGVEGQQMVDRNKTSQVYNFANRARSPSDLASGGSDPVADFSWLLPGANWVETACGFRRKQEVTEMRGNLKYFGNHNPSVYKPIITDALQKKSGFSCECSRTE
ncbi:MAG: hypothetical protein KJ626_03400 [Verrucomicrobia bacterium]|nr:hypothetical protein [Verrucomicrobiota bacterium]